MALSYVLGSVVLVYTIAYAVKRGGEIRRYYKCAEGEKLKPVRGVICEKIDEQNRAIQGVMINLCFPKIEFEVNGEEQHYQSRLRYRDASIGQAVEVAYCEKTGEAWVAKDVPLMKRDLFIRVGTMLSLLALLVVTEVML